MFTKDQRTIFVSQLVQRTTDRDVKRYFKAHNIRIQDISWLRDKRSHRHKGSAYVELRQIQDVPAAVALSHSVPSFQKFPILIKPSEAEKNYVASKTTTLTAEDLGLSEPASDNNNAVEAQKVYVGSLAPTVTQEQLFALFRPFGSLQSVSLQMEASTGVSKGFAFLGFADAKDANLAIQSMSNQVVAGRPMKTGWASQHGTKAVTSDEFPPQASERTQQAYAVLGQLSMGLPASALLPTTSTTTATSSQYRATASTAPVGPAAASATAANNNRVGTVAEARASLASGMAPVGFLPAAGPVAGPSSTSPTAATLGKPTAFLLVHNMFDKDTETEPGWADEIRVEFLEECAKYGVRDAKVMSEEVGGKIYVSFNDIEGAQRCALNLQGRWFDQRQLRVEYVSRMPQ